MPDPSLHLVVNLAHEMLYDAALCSGVTELRYQLELRELLARLGTSLDLPWIAGKCADRRLALAYEVQPRMMHHLFGRSLPHDRRTAVGGLLHRRRIFKMRHELAGRREWSILKRGVGRRPPTTRRDPETGAAAPRRVPAITPVTAQR